MWVPGLTLLLALTPVQIPAESDPAAIVRRATTAVEGDSADPLEAGWSARYGRDSRDRDAALGLAAIAHATYRDTIAERLYRAVMTGAVVDRTAGYAAIGRSRLASRRADWVEADSLAQIAARAGRALGDSSLLGHALIVRGGVRARLEGSAAGLALLDEGMAVLPEREVGQRAFAHCLRSQILSFLGDGAALAVALDGARLAERAGDAGSHGRCMVAAAAEYGRQGLVDSSIAYYADAIEAFRRVRDRAGLAVALQWRSHLNQLVGRYGAAQRDAEEAISEAERANVSQVIPWARSTLARVAFGMGDVAVAAEQAASATEAFERHGDTFGAVSARLFEAKLALTLGELEEARAKYETVVASSRQAGLAAWELDAHWGLADIALRMGDLDGARAELDEVRRIARAGGFQAQARGLGYSDGVVALHAGHLDEAERLFRIGDERATRAAQPNWRYLHLARLAEVQARRGRLADAERMLMEASEALDAWRAQLGDRDLRLLAFQLAEDASDPDLGVATVIASLTRAGRLATAFEVVERGRARDLTDQLNRAAALDTGAAEQVVRGTESRSLAALAGSIPDDSTALLEYVTGRGDPTTLFVITRGGTRAYVLAPQDSLARTMTRLTVLLESGYEPRTLGRQIAAAILDPVLGDLAPAIRRLVVIADGAIHRLPFDALVLPDGRFVVERFAVARAPSASIAARLWERERSTASRMVVLADPRFTGETTQLTGSADVFRSALAGRGGLPRLRGSSREARAIARFAEEVTVRRRDEASEAWLKDAPLSSYGVVHFATHAMVDQGSVANTALALAPTEGEDGFVRPGELAALPLTAELVVLSACRTAGGVLVRGEGIQGLASPLLAAGARAVAATWWPIGDEATVRLVEDFYRSMAEGHPVAEALRLAKLAAIERGAPAREWAAFTIVGDPLARPVLRVPGRLASRGMLLGVALVLAATLSYGAIRRVRASERS